MVQRKNERSPVRASGAPQPELTTHCRVSLDVRFSKKYDRNMNLDQHEIDIRLANSPAQVIGLCRIKLMIGSSVRNRLCTVSGETGGRSAG